MTHSPLLAPIVALVLWSLVMCVWLFATRIPAMVRGKVVADPRRPAEEFHAQLPPPVRWVSDNYTNLMEQPTIFYAVALALVLLGADGSINTGLAWLYIALRVVHSLVQATINIVVIRFGVFITATLVLLALSVRAALVAF
jgi:hypothetical protein